MKLNSLSAREVCRILEVCKRANVDEFEFSGLKVRFTDKLDVKADQERLLREHDSFLGQETIKTNAVPTTGEREAALFDQEALEEAAETQLMIDDPAQYEALQIARDMERHRVMNG